LNRIDGNYTQIIPSRFRAHIPPGREQLTASSEEKERPAEAKQKYQRQQYDQAAAKCDGGRGSG
jgi:hypothetical protein